MLLSLVLVATAVVLTKRAGEPDDGVRRPTVSPTASRLVWALAAATGLAIVTGTVVTGAGPHAGDEEARRFDVSIAAAARIHGITVMAALALAVVLAVLVSRRPADRALQPRPRLVAVRRRAAGRGRLHAVLQRRARRCSSASTWPWPRCCGR